MMMAKGGKVNRLGKWTGLLGLLMGAVMLGGCSVLPKDLTTGPEVGVQYQDFYVSGPAMEPTLSNKDLIQIEVGSPVIKRLERKDIIVFKWPPNPEVTFVKRLIGLPGEKVEINNGKVYVNSQMLDEPYLGGRITQMDTSRVLGKDEYFVMGDNRPNSSDSRIWGPITSDKIIGKLKQVYTSQNRPYDMDMMSAS